PGRQGIRGGRRLSGSARREQRRQGDFAQADAARLEKVAACLPEQTVRVHGEQSSRECGRGYFTARGRRSKVAACKSGRTIRQAFFRTCMIFWGQARPHRTKSWRKQGFSARPHSASARIYCKRKSLICNQLRRFFL